MTSALLARKGIAAAFGTQFGGARDIYSAAGYPTTLQFEDYLARYERQGLGRRIVQAPARETWRLPPEILDGADENSAKSNTAFTDAWDELVTAKVDFANLGAERLSPLYHLREADIQSGVGRYGCLFLGFNDGADLAMPLKKGASKELLYMAVYNEGNAKIEATEQDRKSPRYGLPVTYTLTTETGSIRVHWTRVLHVAEGASIYGTPRLQVVFNDLFDMHKISAAAGESAWRMLLPVYLASTKENYGLAGRVTDETLEDEIDEFVNNARRWLNLEGMEVTVIDGQVVDPRPVAEFYVNLISGATNIPKRLLLGSERGELASSQDERNWATYIEERRDNFATPVLLMPLIRRLVYAGVLPAPASGSVIAKWPALIEPDEKALGEIGEKLSSIVNANGWKLTDIAEFVSTYFPSVDADSVEEDEEPEMPALERMPGAQGLPGENAPGTPLNTPGQTPEQDPEQDEEYP